MAQEHIGGVAACHIECFPDVFTTHMGRKYAEALYRAFASDDDGINFVAVDEGMGQVVGLVVGGTADIRTRFLSRAKREFLWTLLWRGVFDGVVRSALWKEVTRRLRRSDEILTTENAAEGLAADGQKWALLHVICVKPSHRGAGAGAALVSAFSRACCEAGFTHMYLTVFASNAGAIDLYRKKGWEALRVEGDTTFMGRATEDAE